MNICIKTKDSTFSKNALNHVSVCKYNIFLIIVSTTTSDKWKDTRPSSTHLLNYQHITQTATSHESGFN